MSSPPRSTAGTGGSAPVLAAPTEADDNAARGSRVPSGHRSAYSPSPDATSPASIPVAESRGSRAAVGPRPARQRPRVPVLRRHVPALPLAERPPERALPALQRARAPPRALALPARPHRRVHGTPEPAALRGRARVRGSPARALEPRVRERRPLPEERLPAEDRHHRDAIRRRQLGPRDGQPRV